MASAFVGTLEFAKVLMTIFVMLYAYFFLVKAEDFEERRPWMYLFIGSICLFLVEVVATLQLFRGGLFHDRFFTDVKQFLEFSFLAFFLFSFIYQHHLLLSKGVLLIEEKEEEGKEDSEGPGWWQRFKERFLEFEEKAEKAIDAEGDEGEDPEEEFMEEMEGMEEDPDIKKEEESIERLVEEDD